MQEGKLSEARTLQASAWIVLLASFEQSKCRPKSEDGDTPPASSEKQGAKDADPGRGQELETNI